MTGGELSIHRRQALDSLSGQDSHQSTFPRHLSQDTGADRIRSYDTTNAGPVLDAESQHSGETVARISKRVSRAFPKSFTFWERLNGKGRKRIGWSSSFKAIATYTCKL